MAYLDVASFRTRTTIPGEDVDLVNASYPGFIDTRLQTESAWIDGLLRKRYIAPFQLPIPDIVLGWLVQLVTPSVYRKRGVDPSKLDMQEVVAEETRAREEIKEAASAEDSRYDLPLRQDTISTGISRGGPLSYSEASPYMWIDEQRKAIRGSG